MVPELSVDFQADAAYLRLSGVDVAQTREVSPGVMVDLDSFGIVVGVEVLGLDVPIPFTELSHKYHVRQGDLGLLEHIKPNVASFIAIQSDIAPLASSNRLVSA